MEKITKAALRGLVECIIFAFLLAGPALAMGGAAREGDRAEAVQPAAGGISSFSLSNGFNLVSGLPARDFQGSQSANFETQGQTVRLSDLRPYLTQTEHTQNRGNVIFAATMVSLIGLHAADYYLTIQALKYPQCSEGSPLMKLAVKNIYVFAAVKLGISYLSVRYLQILRKNNPVLAWVATTLANGLLTYAVVNNWNAIQRVKRLQP
jgi:Domain of unknown function (DUF5658)